ncbi:LANO_0H05270g1_1 [Lachancea nothofagi CBS 11611]|uniref:LANO_0H05270g1_1 n=1 Tax=Lachancea nothofagi CBS 11611 TaxID=1266666 RepID=A0A1G4KLP2_9SACH|nr:LANO_0H05270g1_1 [Lachancea nothofagi CBS 11611]
MLRRTIAVAKLLPQSSANWPVFKRFFSGSKYSLQTEDSFDLRSTRGKKLKPQKAQIVVLNPQEAGLFKRKRTPAHFQHNDRYRLRGRQSALEGVEFDDSGSSRDSYLSGTCSGDVLQEIESQRRKLLVFKNSVPKEQVVKSIHNLKPSQDALRLSPKRYEQLKTLLETAYTLPQLKEYVKQYFQLPLAKQVPKKTLIPTIMHELWQCQVDDSINEGQDLVVERVIDVQTRDIYLLLLTNNGKILHNFARLGATVAVALSENKIIVRATSALVKYVEVSLRKILDNLQREVLSINDIIRDHTALDSSTSEAQELVSMVQKESATYFERVLEEDSNTYAVTGLGAKRIRKAKVLLLWALNYSPQISETVLFLGTQEQSAYAQFPFTEVNCLDWIERNKDWYRLQKPIKKNADSDDNITPLKLSEAKIDELYSLLRNSECKAVSDVNAKTTSKTWSITLGQILMTDDSQTMTFQPKVPGVTSKLLELPLYDGMATQDELYTVDQHEYYVQLKLIPKLSDSNFTKNIPPLELWFELDDDDKAINSSVRCLLHAEDKSLLLQTPQLPQDIKVNVDRTLEVTKPYEEDPESWLKDQPGLKEFLLKAELTFQGSEKLSVPNNLKLNLQFEDSEQPQSITFEYVNAKYRRILKLKYKDKYLVQFSDVNGGFRGGKNTQIDFINTDSNEMNRADFGDFIKDVLEFI